MQAIVTVERGPGPIIATAIHDGHELRDEVRARMVLDESVRFREEDPFTARIGARAATRLVATRSRFEVDLNRPRDKAVYRVPADCWGLDVWDATPPDELVARSLAEYDAFYAALEQECREVERRHGRFVVLDVHSYNHCRDGAGRPADPAGNPEVNVGTASADRARWGSLIERFCFELSAAGGLDVRENVKFKGGEMSKWVHRTFPQTGCALAVEFKKTFMDEWSGIPDDARIDLLAAALETTFAGLEDSLRT